MTSPSGPCLSSMVRTERSIGGEPLSPAGRMLVLVAIVPPVHDGLDRLAILLDKHAAEVVACALSPDNVLAATAGAGGDYLYLWHVADGSVAQHLTGRGRSVWGEGARGS